MIHFLDKKIQFNQNCSLVNTDGQTKSFKKLDVVTGHNIYVSKKGVSFSHWETSSFFENIDDDLIIILA